MGYVVPGLGAVSGLFGAVDVAAIIKTASAQNTAGGTTPTFSGISIGSAASNRYIVLCWTAAGLTISDFSSATIDGNALTSIATAENGTAGAGIMMSSAPVTTGTTAEFIVNFTNTGCNSCGIVVYAITGLLSATAIGTDSETADATDMTIAVTAGGVAVGIGADSNGLSDGTFTITGLTEDVDEVVETLFLTQGAGSVTTPTTTTLTINFDVSNAASTLQFICASWR